MRFLLYVFPMLSSSHPLSFSSSSEPDGFSSHGLGLQHCRAPSFPILVIEAEIRNYVIPYSIEVLAHGGFWLSFHGKCDMLKTGEQICQVNRWMKTCSKFLVFISLAKTVSFRILHRQTFWCVLVFKLYEHFILILALWRLWKYSSVVL